MGNTNRVKFGLINVHYAILTEKQTDSGAIEMEYGKPIAIPGAVTLALDPKGEQGEFYADNGLYYSTAANQGYTGDLEMALLPDHFRIAVLGDIEDGNGILFENVDAVQKDFALLFEFAGDKSTTRHLLYRVSASRPKIESGTKTASTEPKTETISIVASPRLDDGNVRARACVGDPPYTTWFQEVYQYTSAEAVTSSGLTGKATAGKAVLGKGI